MKQFEYERMTVSERRTDTVYEFEGQKFYDFLSALNALGLDGWQWIGKHEGHYILKREIPSDEEEF